MKISLDLVLRNQKFPRSSSLMVEGLSPESHFGYCPSSFGRLKEKFSEMKINLLSSCLFIISKDIEEEVICE